jgi:hypothetical protein
LSSNRTFKEEETTPAAAPFFLVALKNLVGVLKGSGRSAKKGVHLSPHFLLINQVLSHNFIGNSK